MILPFLETGGMLLGAAVTVFAFAVNIASLVKGRRIFRGPRSCRLKML